MNLRVEPHWQLQRVSVETDGADERNVVIEEGVTSTKNSRLFSLLLTGKKDQTDNERVTLSLEELRAVCKGLLGAKALLDQMEANDAGS